MKKLMKFLTSRLFITALFMLINIVLAVLFIFALADRFAWYYTFCILLSIITMIDIVNSPMNPSFKLTWVILVLCMPMFGSPVYFIMSKGKQEKRTSKKFKEYQSLMRNTLPKDERIIPEIEESEPDIARQCRYIEKSAYAPVYKNTETKYFPSGEEYFSQLLKELSKAERFIFLEYFIIESGVMLDSILDILKKKVTEGVEVRLMYDDFGTISKLPNDFRKKLENMGIRVCVFNKVSSILNAFLNYRDHRKILVIDGNVGFTGGINLADEYINEVEKFGHWKDTGVMLKGEAVTKLTEIFLQLWHFSNNETKVDYKDYAATVKSDSDGYVQPFGESPLDDELTGELCYMGLINCASKSIHITTPYLILDNEMTTALCHAAKSGVDVKIITPHIPDKKIVFWVTKSNYRALLEAGCKIYEYTPGFIHAKGMIVDGVACVLGTINFDFRSFYLHFENGILAYLSSCVYDAEKDFLETMEKSQEITLAQIKKKGRIYAWLQALLKLFSPLM